MANDKDLILIYFSQKGLYNKWKEKQPPHTQVFYVKSEHAGDQAVDSKINKIFRENAEKYEEIYVISHDKGYDSLIQKFRCRLHRKKDVMDRREQF